MLPNKHKFQLRNCFTDSGKNVLNSKTSNDNDAIYFFALDSRFSGGLQGTTTR